MRVKVTPENIALYSLDLITGNKAEVLLERARHEEEHGNELFVNIPDRMGGDTEAPTERNTFEHYSEIPDPDGRMHEQHSVSLGSPCSYELNTVYLDGSGAGLGISTGAWICKQHGMNSKYPVDGQSHAPCLAVETW